MTDTSTLIWGMLFSSFGLGYFIYGKRQKLLIPLLTGITLFIFPYFISNVYLLVFAGITIMLVPWFIKI